MSSWYHVYQADKLLESNMHVFVETRYIYTVPRTLMIFIKAELPQFLIRSVVYA